MAQQTAVDKLIESNQNAAEQFRIATAKAHALHFGKKLIEILDIKTFTDDDILKLHKNIYGSQGSLDTTTSPTHKTNNMTQECKCCGRILDTRMGFCFDCVEAESIIVEGKDMYDKEIPMQESLTKGMSKLQYILKKYIKQNK